MQINDLLMIVMGKNDKKVTNKPYCCLEQSMDPNDSTTLSKVR